MKRKFVGLACAVLLLTPAASRAADDTPQPTLRWGQPITIPPPADNSNPGNTSPRKLVPVSRGTDDSPAPTWNTPIKLVIAPKKNPVDMLLAACASGDAPGVAAALAGGASPDSARPDGTTALMLATKSGSFAAARALLWAGADPRVRDRSGRIALQYLPVGSDDIVGIALLLRAWAFVKTDARPAAAKPLHPERVLIVEPMVNYLHPELVPYYAANQAEFAGRPGVDDDRNGFVDDIYGWKPGTNEPFKIAGRLYEGYLRNRDAIGRILNVELSAAKGEISGDEAREQLDAFTNPLALAMGPLEGLRDSDFLGIAKSAAHGTHVAGIIVHASAGVARLQTLSVDFSRDSARPFGPDSSAFIASARQSSARLDQFFEKLRSRLLRQSTDYGRTSSRYIQTVGAGVSNLSLGGGLAFWRAMVDTQISAWAREHAANDRRFDIASPAMQQAAAKWALDLYMAASAKWAILFAENPDVLFVCAAGNEGPDSEIRNNDVQFPSPGYLARIFPNVISVAACDDFDWPADFSNLGAKSVNIAAPGVQILSTAIPEAPVILDGTSMSAPFVSGTAAWMRATSPRLSAPELRRILEQTVRPSKAFTNTTTTGGVLDPAMVAAYLTGDSEQRAMAIARMANNCAFFDPANYPRQATDAAAMIEEALALAPNVVGVRIPAAFVRAKLGDEKEALGHSAEAVKLAPFSPDAWSARAAILETTGRVADAIAALDRWLALPAGPDNDLAEKRPEMLVWRAELAWKLGRFDEAKRNAAEARRLNPAVSLPDNLAT